MVAALKALNYFKDGDKIIVPVVSFPTTVNPIIQCGLEPIFVDVTLPDCNMNLDEVERLLKLDNNIRGLMLAPVFGNPPNMYRIKRLCARYSLTLMNDECDSLGSSFDGENLGSFGEISTCSFFPAHHMTLCEGGFLATDNFKILKKAASLRD